MKRVLLLAVTLSLALVAAACGMFRGSGGSEADSDETATFQAAILELYDGYCLVQPVEGSAELNSADQITVPLKDAGLSPEVGDLLEIEYDGCISESYPAQITNVYSVRVVEP